MLFNNWWNLLRVVVVGPFVYVALLVLLRSFGKRTLAKMNAFDLVVTVAVGSVLGSAIVSSSVAMAEAVAAIALLTVLQFTVAWLAMRWRWFHRVVKSEPRMLAYRGQLLRDAMARERVAESEVHQAVRSAGISSLDEVHAVVLETDGTFSVVSPGRSDRHDALEGITA